MKARALRCILAFHESQLDVAVLFISLIVLPKSSSPDHIRCSTKGNIYSLWEVVPGLKNKPKKTVSSQIAYSVNMFTGVNCWHSVLSLSMYAWDRPASAALPSIVYRLILGLQGEGWEATERVASGSHCSHRICCWDQPKKKQCLCKAIGKAAESAQGMKAFCIAWIAVGARIKAYLFLLWKPCW